MKNFILFFIFFQVAAGISTKVFADVVSEFPYKESFEAELGAWELLPESDLEWMRYAYGTPSPGTGPDGAKDGIVYLLTEATSPGISFKTNLIEADFILTNLALPELSFYYHMYGRDMGSLHVDVFDGSWHSSVWSRAGQQQISGGNPWLLATVPLSFYSASTFTTIRLRSITSSEFQSDIAIDDIQISEGSARTYLNSIFQERESKPGQVVEYQLNIGNASGKNLEFLMSYDGDWNSSGPPSSGIINHGASTTMAVQVQIAADALHRKSKTTEVTAISSDYTITNELSLITCCRWESELLEGGDFDEWPENWTNYFLGDVKGGWYHDMRFGAVLPSSISHDKIFGVSNWFVSPAIDLSGYSGEKVSFKFSHASADDDIKPAVFISIGSRNPVDGNFVRLADIYTEPVIWTKNEIDLSPYFGAASVYLAFCYSDGGGWQSVDGISVSAGKTGIENAVLIAPSTITVDCYQQIPLIEAFINIPGETGGFDPASDIFAELGIGRRNTHPSNGKWMWSTLPYVGADGNNDSFATNFFITVSGDFDFLCRFRKDAADWVYADLDGSTNGYSSSAAGKLTVDILSTQGFELFNQRINSGKAVGTFSFEDPTNFPGINFVAADDFSFISTATVKSVRWSGTYGSYENSADNPEFKIIIYENSSGNEHPGTIIYEEIVPGYACEQWQNFAPVENVDIYLYHWNLSTPFTAIPEKTYWISIQQKNVFDTYWSVMNSTNSINGFPSKQYDGLYGEWRAGAESDLGIKLYGDRELFTRISLNPEKIIFQDTLIGESNELELTIYNIGDFSVSGAAGNITSPFNIIGDDSYNILQGSNEVLTFWFTPLFQGFFSNVVTLSGANGQTVELEGVGIPEPFTFLFFAMGLFIFYNLSEIK